jgi:hypothetical protein
MHQVCYSQKLYQDARSTEHKIKICFVLCFMMFSNRLHNEIRNLIGNWKHPLMKEISPYKLRFTFALTIAMHCVKFVTFII